MRHSASCSICLAVFLLLFSASSLYQAPQSTNVFGDGTSKFKEMDSWCPIPEFEDIQHRGDGLRPSLDFQKPESIELQVERLSAAVHVPTESWDDNGDVDVDPRWKSFDEFHRILKRLFPKVYGWSTLPCIKYSSPLEIVMKSLSSRKFTATGLFSL